MAHFTRVSLPAVASENAGGLSGPDARSRMILSSGPMKAVVQALVDLGQDVLEVETDTHRVTITVETK